MLIHGSSKADLGLRRIPGSIEKLHANPDNPALIPLNIVFDEHEKLDDTLTLLLNGSPQRGERLSLRIECIDQII